ncbi:MAG: glycosyltransferase [Ignavibacteriales bacterium]|nr:glycosyltransferase [Ignavibacteriales bacterium]
MIMLQAILSGLIILFGIVYLRQIVLFIIGIGRIRPGNSNSQRSVTVIVPARNEQEHILVCLESLLAQDYPARLIEIIVIDDQSTDGTAAIVTSIGERYPRVRLLRVENRPESVSPKINAVTLGITHTTGDVIFTTDADCTAPPTWISTMMRYYEEATGVVTGTTLYVNKHHVPDMLFGIQFLDFLSHTACAAGAIGNGITSNCNGSNFSFRRDAFGEIGGYGPLAQINSGDDSLLAQRIESETHWRVRFVLDPAAHVTTIPVRTWRDFLLQRMRWAGQTAHYNISALIFMVCSFLLFILLFVTLPFSLISPADFAAPAIMFAAKIIIDFAAVLRFTRATRITSVLCYFLPAEVIHIPTILFAVFGGYFGKFDWKGRAMQRTTHR